MVKCLKFTGKSIFTSHPLSHESTMLLLPTEVVAESGEWQSAAGDDGPHAYRADSVCAECAPLTHIPSSPSSPNDQGVEELEGYVSTCE